MQFIDLHAQFEAQEEEIRAAIEGVLKHGAFVNGPEIEALERRLAEFVGVRHCVAVGSGTDALLIALLALGIGPGDEVITTAFSFIATATCIALLGAKPVFVDIEEASYNLDVTKIEAVISDKTKAIIAVDLYGQCADYPGLKAIAAKHQLPLIEDAAQSLGATQGNQMAGSLADIGCTSFFPAKPLGAYGDAGACFTDHDDLAELCRRVRDHGQERRYYHTHLGLNGRMDTLQAAILQVKLKHFPAEVLKRQQFAKQYDRHLSAHVLTPKMQKHNTSSYAQYTIRVNNRDQIQEFLAARDIPSAIHYPLPLPKQPVFFAYCEDKAFANAEQASCSVLSLPLHPYLTDEQIKTITDTVIEANATLNSTTKEAHG